jgi:hypothetical protein
MRLLMGFAENTERGADMKKLQRMLELEFGVVVPGASR